MELHAIWSSEDDYRSGTSVRRVFRETFRGDSRWRSDEKCLTHVLKIGYMFLRRSRK